LRILCSCETIAGLCEASEEGAVDVESVKLNHCWNESRSLKMSGRMKFRRDQSSERLFWERVRVRVRVSLGGVGLEGVGTYVERCSGEDETVGA
jgi:hypothetical protein